MKFNKSILCGAIMAMGMQANAAEVVYSSVDESGLIEMRVWKETKGGNQHNRDVKIDIHEDWVVVGGGVHLDINTAALITASYPDVNTQQSWIVSTKDHGYPSRHNLTAYAIGIKIKGISRSEIREHNIIKTWCGSEQSQTASQNPNSSTRIPESGYLMIGGGARSNWTDVRAGHLMYASFPNSYGKWVAATKDHGYYEKATLTTCIVGIRKDLANAELGHNLGHIEPYQRFGDFNYHPSSRIESTVNMPNGFVLTGVGAEVSKNKEHLEKPDVLLYSMHPQQHGNSSKVVSKAKDHMYGASAYLRSYAIGMKLVK
ncbi:hypothetical protein L1285_15185 [Pseudoalteromonas sp. DL2-H2.2]|uniref:hypothetical protein n=1 Tax=Pseudoalteromonas sp. DL2-H2.2 TaxID=2908889 RepID=UPI001F3180C6|nr:hypothetical protein [Pseudoalteromonas sp. DL2-H2.2]MCF2909667.1 hypothetical protein [Pseudoalteromonas sp. DL2-H2.2]